MAHVDGIWLSDSSDKKPTMRVYVTLEPAGRVLIDVPLPEKLSAAILALAQTAANQEESDIKQSATPKPPESNPRLAGAVSRVMPRPSGA
jgi:hypothetical protein